MSEEEQKYFKGLIGFTFDSDDIKYIEKIVDKKDKEIERLNKALKDIQTILIKKQKAKGLFNQLLNVQEERCLDIVNKALGSDKK